MHTSSEWWKKVKNDPALLKDWLIDQWIGESGAVTRVYDFADCFATDQLYKSLLQLIAIQESNHANWVYELLVNRGWQEDAEEQLETHVDKYWKEVKITSFEYGCSLGAQTEDMRLARIREIAADETAPADIRKVFQKILPQEEFHQKAFAVMAGDSINLAAEDHARGVEALGLIL